MCVDIGYSPMLGPDGLPRYIPGIKINRDLVEADRDRPHIGAHSNPRCLVLVNNNNEIGVRSFGWGIIPGFKTSTPLYNARSEKLMDGGSFWYTHKNNRCLLLADGVYEHQRRGGFNKKIPYYIKLKGGAPLLIPAIFSKDDFRFSIITRTANNVFREIHNSGPNHHRMPLLCPIDKALQWIRFDLEEKERVALLSYLLPDESLDYHTVFSIRGNLVRPDGLRENEFFNWDRPNGVEQASFF
ncbi:MAG: SOS response-associated peptidase family protein [Bacteroidetes bacterium]|nr:SOS response-associated peptidase family protein [Bacteroidota bacterium]